MDAQVGEDLAAQPDGDRSRQVGFSNVFRGLGVLPGGLPPNRKLLLGNCRIGHCRIGHLVIREQRVASPPLPHHRTCGSASGGSVGLS
jgi:hypothetical protein